MTITKRGAGVSLNGTRTEVARLLNDQLHYLTDALDRGELTEVQKDAYAAQRLRVRELLEELQALQGSVTAGRS